jgi:putative ABC transport system substrate-binding protein
MQRTRRHLLRGGLALAGLGVLSGCGRLPLGPPDAPKVPRLGLLAPGSPLPDVQHQAFFQALGDLGYQEGRNVAYEDRWAGDQPERLASLAAELATANVDVILAAGGDAALAAKQATSTTPVVFAAASDPVEAGLVGNLAHPGGNLTGLSLVAPELTAKRVELLRQVAAQASRLAVLADARALAVERQWDELRTAAAALGLVPRRYDVQSADGVDGAFAALAREGAEALLALPSPVFNRVRTRLIELAAQARVPAMYEQRLFTDAGGLLSYGPSLADLYRRAAGYVDKILKGANPAELPVEQPTTFDFIVNLKTAQALGLTIPPSVLQQATELIQ